MTARFGIDLMIMALACVGLWVTVDKTAAGIVRVWAWLVRDRVGPLLEDDETYCYAECPPDCDCSRLELPPEQSAADLGFTSPLEPDIHCNHCTDGCVRCDPRKQDEYRWSPQWERRAPWWEAEHRAAYESLGFDYPSGLMARVRELTP